MENNSIENIEEITKKYENLENTDSMLMQSEQDQCKSIIK
jgi:hypothetical protein